MTIQQALEEFKAFYPEGTPRVHVSRNAHRGDYGGSHDLFYLWKDMQIVASSEISFEHALAIAKSTIAAHWEKDNSEMEATLAD